MLAMASDQARAGSRSRFGRGRRAAVSIQLRSNARRVVMKTRVVRHQGSHFRSAPLPKHINYLKREGVTQEGEDARNRHASAKTGNAQHQQMSRKPVERVRPLRRWQARRLPYP